MVIDRRTGRPPIYRDMIERVTVDDGWVPITQHANSSAPAQFRRRYPGWDFRAIPNKAFNRLPNQKPYVLEARKSESEDGR